MISAYHTFDYIIPLCSFFDYSCNYFLFWDELDIDANNKRKQKLKERVNHIYVLIHYDQNITIGNANEFNTSSIVHSIKTENKKYIKIYFDKIGIVCFISLV